MQNIRLLKSKKSKYLRTSVYFNHSKQLKVTFITVPKSNKFVISVEPCKNEHQKLPKLYFAVYRSRNHLDFTHSKDNFSFQKTAKTWNDLSIITMAQYITESVYTLRYILCKHL